MILGHFQYQILTVLMKHLDHYAYGAEVWRQLPGNGGRGRGGDVYTTLIRMENRGLVTSEWSEPTPEPGGRRRRYYEITAAGIAAVKETGAHFASP